jgi:hypothetical protein
LHFQLGFSCGAIVTQEKLVRSVAIIWQLERGENRVVRGTFTKEGANPSAPGEKPGAASFSQDYGMAAPGVRRAKAALSSGWKSHPAIAPAGSNRSSHGGNEVAEAFD